MVSRLRAGGSEYDSQQELGPFLLATASRPALGPTQLSYPMGIGVSFPGGKAAGM